MVARNVGSGSPGGVARKRNEGAELIARLVSEDGRGSADERLPEELEGGILLEILAQAEGLQMRKSGLT